MAKKKLRKIHLVFKNHVDIGYTDYAGNVVRKYFEEYFPRAVQTARTMRRRGEDELFTWTLGSWLIYEYLETAKKSKREWLTNAIEEGFLTWHAIPFTTHSELMSPELFRFGLSLSKNLDERFGRKTIAGKMTDVPGHTRAIIPLLEEAGIRVLHIGANPGSTPPDVPDAFRWRDENGKEVLVLYQRGEFGGLTRIQDMDEALMFAHAGDNRGPPISDQVREIYFNLKNKYPGVKVVNSTLNQFAHVMLRRRPKLPIVEGEMADTWIHGAATDPTKMRRYRALLRLHDGWVRKGIPRKMMDCFKRFQRNLLLVPEHTCGLDEKTHLTDYVNYSVRQLARARKTEVFRNFEASWEEQRNYLKKAVRALGQSPQGKKAREVLKRSEPKRPGVSGATRLSPGRIFETEHFKVRFDPESGALTKLQGNEGKDWASSRRTWGRYTYELFSKSDYDRFLGQYIYPDEELWWFEEDFSKPGMEKAGPREKQVLHPEFEALWVRDSEDAKVFILDLRSLGKYGMPKQFFTSITFPKKEKKIIFDCQWFSKRANRLPEALWVSFAPRVEDAEAWKMSKLGQLISPFEVLRNGNKKLHAVDQIEHHEGLRITNLDSPLAAPGERSLLDFNNRKPPLQKGWHFNLYNNLWGTNFPMWFDEPARFRFLFEFDKI